MKRGLKYYTYIYLVIVAQGIKSKMHYRADFVISNIGMIVMNLAGFVSFWLIYQNFPNICGWSFYEMLFLYGFALVSVSPAQIFFDNLWNLSNHVQSGQFLTYCFRPINIFFYYVAEVVDLKGIGQALLGAVVMIVSVNKLHISFSIASVIWLIVMIVSSGFVMIGILTFAAAFTFWVIQSQHILMLMEKFRDYAKYPTTIFNSVFRVVFSFIIPIGFISYYPSLFFVHRTEMSVLSYIAPFFSVLFFYVAYRFWMYGAMKYDGTGS